MPKPQRDPPTISRPSCLLYPAHNLNSNLFLKMHIWFGFFYVSFSSWQNPHNLSGLSTSTKSIQKGTPPMARLSYACFHKWTFFKSWLWFWVPCIWLILRLIVVFGFIPDLHKFQFPDAYSILPLLVQFSSGCMLCRSCVRIHVGNDTNPYDLKRLTELSRSIES